MFGSKQSALLGIDISSTAVRLIELSHHPSKAATPYRVEHFASEPLPPEVVSDKKILDIEAVGRAIRAAVVRSGTRARRAAVAVAGSSVITKVIVLPARLNDAEMENQIELDADQYIPYPLDEVRLDFEVLGSSDAGSDMVDVLLSASRRDNVDERVGALEAAGLVPAVVDVEAYAIENACSRLLIDDAKTAATQVSAIVDIGTTATVVHVTQGGQIIYSREQNFGGRQLLEEVQRRYGLSREEAIPRIQAGNVAPNYERELLTPFQDALTQQIGRAIQFFYSATKNKRIEQMFLAGAPAGLPGMDAMLNARLNLPVCVANPFARMSMAHAVKQDELLRDAPGYLVAVGLALRGFD